MVLYLPCDDHPQTTRDSEKLQKKNLLFCKNISFTKFDNYLLKNKADLVLEEIKYQNALVKIEIAHILPNLVSN